MPALTAALTSLVGDRAALLTAQDAAWCAGQERYNWDRDAEGVPVRVRRGHPMKRVVLVAPEFPPFNTAGAHRPRLFAKHLAEFGWTPTVLTIRRDQIEGPLDPLLEQLVDPGLDTREDRRAAGAAHPLHRRHGHRTLPYHADALRAAIRQGGVGAVVLFGPPWFSFLLGPLMRRWTGTPYVVDYIDPWMSDWTRHTGFRARGGCTIVWLPRLSRPCCDRRRT